MFQEIPLRNTKITDEFWKPSIDLVRESIIPVSYTHLDVYKRQSYLFHGLPTSWLDGQESTTPVVETKGAMELGETLSLIHISR